MFSRLMRALLVTLLLGTSCRSKVTSEAESPREYAPDVLRDAALVKECEAGKALPASEHLHRCSALIKQPRCRQYVFELDGGALEPGEFGERCWREYCGRFSRPVSFCVGERGAPASYAPELDFFNAVFEADYGASSTLAKGAFFVAAERNAEAQIAALNEERRLERRRAQLILDLDGDSDLVTVTVLRPGGIPGFSGPTASLDAERCRAVIAGALDGGTLSGRPVIIEAGKRVPFQAVRCLEHAASEAGATAEAVSISTK